MSDRVAIPTPVSLRSTAAQQPSSRPAPLPASAAAIIPVLLAPFLTARDLVAAAPVCRCVCRPDRRIVVVLPRDENCAQNTRPSPVPRAPRAAPGRRPAATTIFGGNGAPRTSTRGGADTPTRGGSFGDCTSPWSRSCSRKIILLPWATRC